MSLQNLNPSSSAADWDQKWAEIFDHYQQDIRHAHYVRALLRPDEDRILEIAAGSFRDVAALCRRGVDGEGMDFSKESVLRAQAAYPEYSARFHQMSAFSMPVPDKSFDVTYHNGFWVLFPDEEIRALAAEQARITRKRMIVTVHNKHNSQFLGYFDRMKKADPLYDIRFFGTKEISTLLEAVCTDIEIIPVGKQKRRWEDWLIKKNWTHPTLLRWCLKMQRMSFLDNSERLLCIGTPR